MKRRTLTYRPTVDCMAAARVMTCVPYEILAIQRSRPGGIKALKTKKEEAI